VLGGEAVTGDKAIRWSTVAAVAVVALVAAFVSYRHALAVVTLHGEGWPVAQLYPLTIDGLIYAASMVLLDSARRRRRPPVLAYAALGLGIAATLAANVAAGVAFGAAGAVIAAWPAPALVISYELLMWLVWTGAAPAPAVPAAGNGAPGWLHAAHEEFAGDLAAGRVPAYREIRSRLRVGASRAHQARAYFETLTRT
jgi:Protein of unknown function (DUF2637)